MILTICQWCNNKSKISFYFITSYHQRSRRYYCLRFRKYIWKIKVWMFSRNLFYSANNSPFTFIILRSKEQGLVGFNISERLFMSASSAEEILNSCWNIFQLPDLLWSFHLVIRTAKKNPQILAALKDIKLNCILQEEIYRLEKGIESDQKLKHMAELQISVVADPGSKHQIQVAISGG